MKPQIRIVTFGDSAYDLTAIAAVTVDGDDVYVYTVSGQEFEHNFEDAVKAKNGYGWLVDALRNFYNTADEGQPATA